MSDKYLPNLGALASPDAQRDAVHIAVAPVIAHEELWPGTRVVFVYGSQTHVRRARDNDTRIGIVDPFLALRVNEGERFWMFLMPNTITFLRHHWEHPAFDQSAPKGNESEVWIRSFADGWNFDYDELIQNASAGNEYVVARGVDLHSQSELGEDHALFWHHLGILKGRTFDKDHQDNFGWSCFC